MALASGTRLGPYEVTAQIGVGGMGEVYRGTDTEAEAPGRHQGRDEGRAYGNGAFFLINPLPRPPRRALCRRWSKSRSATQRTGKVRLGPPAVVICAVTASHRA